MDNKDKVIEQLRREKGVQKQTIDRLLTKLEKLSKECNGYQERAHRSEQGNVVELFVSHRKEAV